MLRSRAWSAWYSGDRFEIYTHLVARPTGPYAFVFWTVIACNGVVPQVLWSRHIRRSPLALWIVAGLVQVGMWAERLMLIVTSQAQDFLPSSWGLYWPTVVDWTLFFGTISFFLFLFLLFLRFLPAIAIAEVKGVMPEADPHHGHGHHGEVRHAEHVEAH